MSRRLAQRPCRANPRTQLCREYLEALWVLAWLGCGGDASAAESAVIAAVRDTTCDPHPDDGGDVWHAVAGRHLRRRLTPALAAAGTTGDCAWEGYEALALVVTGRSPTEAAAVIGVSVAQVHHGLRRSLAASWSIAGAVTR
ncbi:MAG TPA: hypothetical protein VFP61_06125 [Acidimicrobiales bacterium]|nr:hypothetical protein [Acidimicrobiales bacterium]